MPDLVVCPSCRHGVMYHSGTGCEVPDCSCIVTKECLVEETVERARLEIAVERSNA